MECDQSKNGTKRELLETDTMLFSNCLYSRVVLFVTGEGGPIQSVV